MLPHLVNINLAPPLPLRAAEELLELVMRCYERTSTLLTCRPRGRELTQTPALRRREGYRSARFAIPLRAAPKANPTWPLNHPLDRRAMQRPGLGSLGHDREKHPGSKGWYYYTLPHNRDALDDSDTEVSQL